MCTAGAVDESRRPSSTSPWDPVSPNALNRLPLSEMYARYVSAAEAGDEETVAEIVGAISERADQALCLGKLSVISMSDRDLEEYAIRLRAGQDINEALDPAVDAAQREYARVQSIVVEEEMDRRREFHRLVSSGDLYAPTRAEMVGSLVVLAEMVGGDDPDPMAVRSIEASEALVENVLADGATGAAALAAVLRRLDDLPPSVDGDHPVIRWVTAAALVEMVVSTHGFARRSPLDVDPVTRAEGSRMKRLAFAFDRQDPRYEEDDWPLDLQYGAIAEVLEQAEAARAYWHNRSMPEEEIRRYLVPPAREEPGRPEPHRQIVPRADAMASAERAGGVPFPMLYPLAPRVRRAGAEEIWNNGLPALPESELGWSIYGMPGDMRLRGGLFPHPDGVLIAVILPPERILSVGRVEGADPETGEGGVLLDREHEEILEKFQIEAERRASAGHLGYRQHLRQILTRAGYLAIARYDYLYRATPTPQEMILLDPSPRYVSVIRESVPVFVTEEELNRIPRNAPRTAP